MADAGADQYTFHLEATGSIFLKIINTNFLGLKVVFPMASQLYKWMWIFKSHSILQCSLNRSMVLEIDSIRLVLNQEWICFN